MERQGGNRMDPAELGTYVNTRSIQSFEYEPHGKRISFISDWKGSPQVWEYDNRQTTEWHNLPLCMKELLSLNMWM